MPGTPLTKLTDVLTYMLSIAFAAGCVAFASYKVIKLNGMENPPANMGLNFPPPKRKIITDEETATDSLITQTISPDETRSSSTARPVQPFSTEAPVESYRLLTVIDGVAFVEIKTFRGKEIVPVSQGARLPGAGPVSRLEQVGRSWVLTAGDVKLVSGQ